MNPKLSVCILCGEPTGIALESCKNDKESICIENSKEWNEAPEKVVTSLEPCDSCNEKYKDKFVIFIMEGDKPSGEYILLDKEEGKKFLNDDFVKNYKNFALIEKEIAKKIGFI
jgi:hypothetical protein